MLSQGGWLLSGERISLALFFAWIQVENVSQCSTDMINDPASHDTMRCMSWVQAGICHLIRMLLKTDVKLVCHNCNAGKGTVLLLAIMCIWFGKLLLKDSNSQLFVLFVLFNLRWSLKMLPWMVSNSYGLQGSSASASHGARVRVTLCGQWGF